MPRGDTPQPRVRGWWRRNIWGLVALLPVLALALGPSVKEGLDRYNRVEAHEAVLPGADGWVSHAGARMRIVEFGPATDLVTYGGEVFQPPAGTKAWKATLAVDAPDEETVAGCTLALEDAEGRLFSTNPTELSGTRKSFSSCTPAEDGATAPWQAEIYFVTPESARPAAVRIVFGLHLPRYARLPAS